MTTSVRRSAVPLSVHTPFMGKDGGAKIAVSGNLAVFSHLLCLVVEQSAVTQVPFGRLSDVMDCTQRNSSSSAFTALLDGRKVA